MWRDRSQNTSTLIKAPLEVKGHQLHSVSPWWGHGSMYQGWLWYVKGQLRYGLTSCLATWRSNLIGCSGQTVLNLKSLSDVLYQAWPEDHVCQVSRWLDKICDSSSILKVFDINQDDGKSIMAQNDVINGALNSAWFKESNDTWFVNIGWMGQKL
jgi:hypothetical protein